MAAAVGKMTSARVSDVIRGVRGIRGQQVIERVADGFGIPGEMLGLPRRPWEGSPEGSERPDSVAYPSPSQATAEKATTPVVANLSSVEEVGKSELPDVLLASVWIEGRRQVVSIGRRSLIAGALGAAMSMPSKHSHPDVKPAALPKPDPNRIDAAAEHLKEMWHALVRADNLFGPRCALTSVHQQLSILESLLDFARGEQRIELLRLAAKYAESAAWLHEDSAGMSNAVKWTSQAMEWATEAGDQHMVTWSLFRRSQQATTKKNAGQVISLAQAVQRNHPALTSPMRAAAMQQEAHGHALDRDELSCHSRLDEAHEFAASPETKGDARSGHGDFCTGSYIEIQRASCWLTLGRPELAVPVFEAALSKIPDAYERDRGLAQARLAMAYAGIREYDQAASQATSALSIARSSGSTRTMHETVAAVNALGEAHNSQAVSNLFDAIEEGESF
ncbi:hypothetical protein ACH40E_30575 [Streptomyces acidicola]|uniref:hypothetical protein n=1 Tax=Streptomyces acidicola TaxID=2596892 RepID=UPI0037A05916